MENIEKEINNLNLNHSSDELDDFDYLFVLDFEAQCIEYSKLNVQEIIELPVVIVDVKNKTTIENYFHTYVKPTEHTKLFHFCIELTGITQDQVDSGLILQEALEALDKFIIENNMGDSKFCFVTCGDWDLQTCLAKEAIFKKITYKDYLKSWINIKNVYAECIGEKKRTGMKEMLKEFGLILEGRHHSGIDDARNIARIAIHMLKNSQKFSLKHVNKLR